MGRLMQGAALLLLLATIARADDWSGSTNGNQKFSDKSKISLSVLLDKKQLDDATVNKTQFLEAILVAKTCLRDWVRDEECPMHEYQTAAKNIGKADAKIKYPKGYEQANKTIENVKDLKKIYDDGNTGHFMKVLDALQDNFIEMIEYTNKEEESMSALKKHLESDEFKDMFKDIEAGLAADGISMTKHDKYHSVARQAIAHWIEAEKEKSVKGTWQRNNTREDWEKKMNKIPDTLKYKTRGATPVIKKHLRGKFEKGFNGDADALAKYTALKEKSEDYLQALANRMRHEAMKKSNTLIAQVMHAVEMGVSHEDMVLGMKHSDDM